MKSGLYFMHNTTFLQKICVNWSSYSSTHRKASSVPFLFSQWRWCCKASYSYSVTKCSLINTLLEFLGRNNFPDTSLAEWLCFYRKINLWSYSAVFFSLFLSSLRITWPKQHHLKIRSVSKVNCCTLSSYQAGIEKAK